MTLGPPASGTQAPDPGGDGQERSLRDLISMAEELIERGERTILGITGAPGAGKTTVCESLTTALGGRAALVQMDGFHLADAELRRIGRRERKGAPDTFDVAGYAALLERLRSRRDDVVYAPRFDRELEDPIGSAVPVPREVPLVVTEGNYLLHEGDGWARIGPLLDACWYLDVDDALRESRLVDRRILHGDTPEHSRRWAREVDGANARIVGASRGLATRAIRVVP